MSGGTVVVQMVAALVAVVMIMLAIAHAVTVLKVSLPYRRH